MDRDDLIYLAGLFDGEGYIGIAKNSRAKTGPSYMLQIALTMTDPYAPSLLHQTFGGSLYLTKRSIVNPKHADAWSWFCASVKAAEALRQLHPFIRIKKPQADLALEYQAVVGRVRPQPGFASKQPEEVRALREHYYMRLRALKRAYTAAGQTSAEKNAAEVRACAGCNRQFLPRTERGKRGTLATYCTRRCRRSQKTKRQKLRVGRGQAQTVLEFRANGGAVWQEGA